VVTLPRLKSYTSEQLTEASRLSPAFARYYALMSQPHLDGIHARRHQAWCEAVAATYFSAASTESICAYWSDVADELLREAWRVCGLERNGALLLALGKHGARELNLSSDIDLMIVGEPKDSLEIEKGLRRFQHILQHNGEMGFCFRLDFDLRPGGKLGPMLTSPAQFQDYYWSQGETWERLALVRLRPIVGARAIESQILDLARRFSFRKFLDFTLLEDLKALRSKVHQNGFRRKSGELHLKLEVGGIRDIELFVHSLLILNGGKIPELQTPSTSEAIHKLSVRGLLSAQDAKTLHETYWLYRHVENVVQSVNDRQTHAYTSSLPAFSHMPGKAEIETRQGEIDLIVSSLLGQVDLATVHLPGQETAQREWLESLGFKPETVSSIWPQLSAATALSHKNDRDERARQEFLYAFISEVAKHQDRDMGFAILVDFVKATRAKASFFTMLLRVPRLIQDLARLFCLSPYLGHILASRPELLEHFILQVDEDWSLEIDVQLKQMAERKLLTEIWAANQFMADHDLNTLQARITNTADEICLQLLQQLKGEFKEATVEILSLGKWGGRELGLRSDLDFIFVVSGKPVEADFKVARRFISRLTDPVKSGTLFDVDLRLRPSGQSGPLLVERAKLHEYWLDSAQAWERQAYLRARPLDERLDIDKAKLVNKGLSAADLAQFREIRGKLLRPMENRTFDLKHLPGGLIDIEFMAQIQLLADRKSDAPTDTVGMIAYLGATNPRWKSRASRLIENYVQIRRFEQAFQLASTRKTAEVDADHPVFAKAAHLLALDRSRAWEELKRRIESSKEILDQLDPLVEIRI
jgi:glutamate-ammonia-ligase adenylyltransferase